MTDISARLEQAEARLDKAQSGTRRNRKGAGDG
jgi:hypothetical protein